MFSKILKYSFFIGSLFTSFLTFADNDSIVIDAPSLSNATIDTASKQNLYIYLPPSYASSNKQYPVMYYLHGYGGKANEAEVIGDFS